MNVVGKVFDTDINSVFQSFGAKVLTVYKVSNIALFSLKVIMHSLCKYKTELDPGHNVII